MGRNFTFLILFFFAKETFANSRSHCPLLGIILEKKDLTSDNINVFETDVSGELPEYRRLATKHREALTNAVLDQSEAGRAKFDEINLALTSKRQYLVFATKWLRQNLVDRFEVSFSALQELKTPYIDEKSAGYEEAHAAVKAAINIKNLFDSIRNAEVGLSRAIRLQTDVQQEIQTQEKDFVGEVVQSALNNQYRGRTNQIQKNSQDTLNVLRGKVERARSNINREITILESKLRDNPNDQFTMDQKTRREKEVVQLNAVLKKEKLTDEQLFNNILDGKKVDYVFEL